MGNSFKSRFSSLESFPDEELVQVVRSYSDHRAFNVLASRYRNIILSVVKRYSGCHFSYDDIYQEASIGLWEACFIHNPNRKNGFPALAKRRAHFRAIRYVSANKW